MLTDGNTKLGIIRLTLDGWPSNVNDHFFSNFIVFGEFLLVGILIIDHLLARAAFSSDFFRFETLLFAVLFSLFEFRVLP